MMQTFMAEDSMMKDEMKRRCALARMDRMQRRFELKLQFMFKELRFQAQLEKSSIALACYYYPQRMILMNEKQFEEINDIKSIILNTDEDTFKSWLFEDPEVQRKRVAYQLFQSGKFDEAAASELIAGDPTYRGNHFVHQQPESFLNDTSLEIYELTFLVIWNFA